MEISTKSVQTSSLPNQFKLHTSAANNQDKYLEPLEPVYNQYFTSKVKLMLKNEKSHYIAILALTNMSLYSYTLPQKHYHMLTCFTVTSSTSKNQP